MRAEDRKLDARLSHFAWQLTEVSGEDVPWFVRGPERMHLEEAPLVSECVAVWERCSRQLEALCVANDIRYVHVLQPNQYDPGSKPLSDSEKDTAFDPEGPYKPAIERGYPLLREAGERLRADGVTFIDLSRVFEDTKETLYVDNCCHFNKAGNRILVDAIAGELAKEIARTDS